MDAQASSWAGPRPTSGQIVYLDQWCWERLAKEHEAREVGGLFDVLREAVGDGRVVIPLFQSHLQEIWHRAGAARRRRVASTMGELSGFITVYPKPLYAWECNLAVVEHFGLEVAVDLPEVFGVGIEHLVTGKQHVWQLRLNSAPDGFGLTAMSAPLRARFEEINRAFTAEMEYTSLAKAPPFMTGAFEPGASLHGAVADAFTQEQSRIQQAITQHGHTPSVVRNSVILTGFSAAFHGLAAAAADHGRDWVIEADRLAGLPPSQRMDVMESIVDAMPVHSTYTRLRHQAHLNPQFVWKDSDAMDFRAMAEALPLVDVLVADKKCVDLMGKADVGERHGVTVTRKLDALPAILGLTG